jgi:DNA mismatch repair protein MutS2
MLEIEKILQLLANKCVNRQTKKRALEQTPSYDYNVVCEKLEKTNDALALILQYGSPSFYDFDDISNSVTLAKAGRSLSALDLLNISRMLTGIKSLGDWYENSENSLSYKLQSLNPIGYLRTGIENAIISENEISDNASPELYSIRKRKIKAERQLRENLESIVKSKAKYLQDSLITLRDGRLVIPVKEEYRTQIQGIIHDTSKATVFIEPQSTVEANNNIRLLQIEELQEIEKILAELSQMVGENAEDLLVNYENYIELELYFAKAKLGERCNTPKIGNKISLKDAKHPLIKNAVPVDIELNGVLIISGSNMGGKTAALKTVGLLTLMTLCGLLIPAKGEIRIFSKILVDIGDNQDIEQGLSSFSSHLIHIIDILENADKDTLILLDEPMNGTDPVEGGALSVAIIDELRKKEANIIATTHYQELKLYAMNTEGVKCSSVEFDLETLTPKYKLIDTVGSSYALYISKKLGLPENIIKNAEQIISEDSKDFEKAIEELRIKNEELESIKLEIEALKNDMKNNAEIIKKQAEISKTEIENAKKRANNIIDETKAKTNGMLTELERLIKEQKRSEAEKLVEKTFAELEQKENKPVKLEKGKKIILTGPDDFPRERRQTNFNRAAKSELDIRGYDCNEGLMEMEGFINDAILAGKSQVTIIHGRGTGALRNACQARLKNMKAIKSYRNGKYGEGEDGVTIVVLK